MFQGCMIVSPQVRASISICHFSDCHPHASSDPCWTLARIPHVCVFLTPLPHSPSSPAYFCVRFLWVHPPGLAPHSLARTLTVLVGRLMHILMLIESFSSEPEPCFLRHKFNDAPLLRTPRWCPIEPGVGWRRPRTKSLFTSPACRWPLLAVFRCLSLSSSVWVQGVISSRRDLLGSSQSSRVLEQRHARSASPLTGSLLRVCVPFLSRGKDAPDREGTLFALAYRLPVLGTVTGLYPHFVGS